MARIYPVVIVDTVTGLIMRAGPGPVDKVKIGPNEINIGPADVEDETNKRYDPSTGGLRGLNATELAKNNRDRRGMDQGISLSAIPEALLQVLATRFGIELEDLKDEIREAVK